ncbi:hypothetical protein [Actinomadura sp. NPDC049753]|uniref:hypothetical protein n=1 Tax=Actinomadura sp. NPDC049753 TaxID=3154739 RepID=UPI00343B9088
MHLAPAGDAAARVDALIRTLLEYSPQSLPLGRRLVRLTVDPPANGARPSRSPRRVEWLEQACRPLHGVLSEESFQRLISALTIVVGREAQITLRDFRGLDPEAEQEAITWAARVLVEAAIKEES